VCLLLHQQWQVMHRLAKLPLESADLSGGLALLRNHLPLSSEHRGYIFWVIWISAVPKDRLHVKGVVDPVAQADPSALASA
jgi:hypothetical protein